MMMLVAMTATVVTVVVKVPVTVANISRLRVSLTKRMHTKF